MNMHEHGCNRVTHAHHIYLQWVYSLVVASFYQSIPRDSMVGMVDIYLAVDRCYGMHCMLSPPIGQNANQTNVWIECISGTHYIFGNPDNRYIKFHNAIIFASFALNKTFDALLKNVYACRRLWSG